MCITNSKRSYGMMGKSKPKKKKKNRDRVIIDTNVIFSGIGLGSKVERKAINRAKKKDRHIYTPQVDSELSNYHGKPRIKRRLELFRRKNREKIENVRPPKPEELIQYPAKGKDKIILHEAKETNTNIIVTEDKKFVKKADRRNFT